MIFKKITINEFERLRNLFPDSDELWEKYAQKRLNELASGEADVFVIEENNEFIGEITVNYVSHTLPTETIAGIRVYLEAFRLLKEYQGKGLGQKLLDYAIMTLTNAGFLEFTIGVEDGNKRAIHIYQKYGFTKEIDHGHGDEFDHCDYTLYLKR